MSREVLVNYNDVWFDGNEEVAVYVGECPNQECETPSIFTTFTRPRILSKDIVHRCGIPLTLVREPFSFLMEPISDLDSKAS